jgi:predicted dehydrogenase
LDDALIITAPDHWHAPAGILACQAGKHAYVAFYGENGALLIDGNAYTIYDLKNNVVKEVKNTAKIDPNNLMSPAASLEHAHAQNFLDGIRKGTPLVSPILSGHQSTLLSQLGNIAQRTGRTLNINPENGHILNDPEAMQYWSREYAPGWEPKV